MVTSMPAPRVFDSERMLAIFLREPENSQTRHLISRATYQAFVRYPPKVHRRQKKAIAVRSHCCLRSADIWGRGCASTCVASGSRYAMGRFCTLDALYPPYSALLNRSLSSELSAARRSLLLRSLASSPV